MTFEYLVDSSGGRLGSLSCVSWHHSRHAPSVFHRVSYAALHPLNNRLCKIKDHWWGMFDSHTPSKEFVESTIETIMVELDALWVKWFDPNRKPTFPTPLTLDAPPAFEQDKELGIAWSILDFMLIVRRHRLELAPEDSLRRHACLEVACRIVDNIERLAETGALAYLQDTASTMTSSLGVLLRKVRRQYKPC